MISRRAFIATVTGILAAPLVGEAQQSERRYQIGILTVGTDPARSVFWQKFMEAMRELSYVEGGNFTVRRAFAEGKVDRLPSLVADLVQAKVDVIVSTSTLETSAAKRATATIPIVMTVTPDPVEQGLVVSLARPGANVTGLTTMAPATSQKLVELLREAVPSASRFAVLTSGPKAPFPEIRRELQTAAHETGVALSFAQINGLDDLDAALGRAKKEGAGGIIAPLSAFTYAHRATLAKLTLKHRLPGIYWVRDYVEEGGLMSYGADVVDVSRRAAYFVDRILKGAKPADLPVEQPTKFELVINLKTAKALGLTIPPSLLLRADQIIQ